MKLKKTVWNLLSTCILGFSNTVRIWTNIGKANVLTTVTFPTRDKFLNDQSERSVCTDCNFSLNLTEKWSAFSNSYFMPSNLNFPSWFQIIGWTVRISSPQPRFAPIHTACVFSKLAFNPEHSPNILIRNNALLRDSGLLSRVRVESSAYCVITY